MRLDGWGSGRQPGAVKFGDGEISHGDGNGGGRGSSEALPDIARTDGDGNGYRGGSAECITGGTFAGKLIALRVRVL